MNQIRLYLEYFHVDVFPDGGARMVVISIDGVPVMDYIGRYHPEVLLPGNSRSRYGRWIGVPPYLVLPPARDFLGEPGWTIIEDGHGRVPLVVCSECGEPGCDGLWARIEMTDEIVRWTDFYKNPGLNPMALDRVPDLVFDRKHYTSACESLG